MKIQRKLLSEEQKKAICKKYHLKEGGCHDTCPLIGVQLFKGRYICIKGVPKLEQAIKDYWNEEVEVEV